MGAHASSLEPGDTVNADVTHLLRWELKKIKKSHDRYGKISKTPGVGLEAFNEIFALDESEGKTFRVFDTDENGKVDVNEVFGVLASCAKGTLSRKLKMIYQLFDFDHNGALNEYETIIMLRSVLTGLEKITSCKEPDIDLLAKTCKEVFDKANTVKDDKITFMELNSWVRSTPAATKLFSKFSGKAKALVLADMDDILHGEEKGKAQGVKHHERKALYTAPKGSNPKKKVSQDGRKYGKHSKYSKKEVMDLFGVFAEMDVDGTGDVDIREFKHSLRVGCGEEGVMKWGGSREKRVEWQSEQREQRTTNLQILNLPHVHP